MTELLTHPRTYTIAGILILAAGLYALARGTSARRRLSFFQLSLVAGLWVVIYGTLLESGADPESLRRTADLFVFLGLLVATTAYQFVTHGLRFGAAEDQAGERRRGVIIMWGIAATVGMGLASGEFELVQSVGNPAAGASLTLHWHAIPVVVAVWAGIFSALIAAGRTWIRSPIGRRSGRAAWVVGAVTALAMLPLALHTSVFGEWASAAAGAATLAGTLILGGVARLEPAQAQALLPQVRSTLEAVRGPAVATGRDGRIVAVNDAFPDRFGHRPRRLVGKPLGDLVGDLSGSQLPLSALSLDIGGDGREVELEGPDGRPVHCRLIATQLGHVDGEALPTLFLFVPESAESDRPLRSGPADRWLRYGFRPEVPAIGLFGLDDGRFTAVTDQFLQLTGYAREDLIGQSAADLHLSVYANRWDQILQEISRDGYVEEVELEIRRGGGGVQHVEVFGMALPGAGQSEVLLLARDLTARKKAEEKLRGQVLYDALTGLPNRTLFEEQLDHALDRARRYQKRVGVLFIDLDGFKEVNDSHGHAAGDQLLAGVAWRLYECFRQMDALCRYGGDEFLVLLEDLEDSKGAAAAADRFRRQLEAPFRLEGGSEATVGATIGVAVSVPGQTEGEDLIRWADVAMYRAKRSGESPIYVYDPERDAAEMERLSQADDLRQAIQREELTLVYQPLIALASGEIVGAEALVRWRLSSGEVRTPGEFLPLAEETGLIVPMSDWIFGEAARQAREWRELAPSFKMSVNVAAQHFRDPSLKETLREVLNEVGIPSDAFQLEITESAALRDTRAIDRLRDLGVRVAVDDFGTGYSSLEYIRGLGVDGVKIDRVFVNSLGEDPKDQAIVRAVLLMAEAFELEVTAEGIETGEQLTWLREMGCHLGQGYHFSRPLPAREFEELLRRPDPDREGPDGEDGPTMDEPW